MTEEVRGQMPSRTDNSYEIGARDEYIRILSILNGMISYEKRVLAGLEVVPEEHAFDINYQMDIHTERINAINNVIMKISEEVNADEGSMEQA